MPGRVRGRVRRRPLLIGVLVLGVLGALLIVALGARPSAESPTSVAVDDAYVGTTYAFDGVVCLGSPQVGSEVLSVEVEQAQGTTTRLVQAPEGRPTLGFPVADEGDDVPGYRLPAGEDDCTLRLLVTPTERGTVRAGTVRVEMAYGPFGLLRRTAAVQPQVRLEVTGEGEDPRGDTQ